jgi:hypothetical protein
MLKRARTAILSFLAAASLLVDGPLTATAEVRLPDATSAASPKSFIGWIAVTRSRMTSRSGRLAKMSGGASNSHRLAG